MTDFDEIARVIWTTLEEEAERNAIDDYNEGIHYLYAQQTIAAALRKAVDDSRAAIIKQCTDICYEHWQYPQTHYPSDEALKIISDIEALEK
jgi:hypothetical protein